MYANKFISLEKKFFNDWLAIRELVLSEIS